jgi:hypothetical protein
VLPDLHDYWDQRCQSCHGDAGPFARSTLTVDSQGRLLGRHHKDDLARFLKQHYLADEMVETVMAMLRGQATTPPLFRQHCASCHGRASSFARESLVLEGGVLKGRTGARVVAQLLRAHGDLDAAEVPVVVESLTRVLGEVTPKR